LPNLSQFDPAASVTSGIMGRSAKLSHVVVIVIVVEVNSSYMKHDQDLKTILHVYYSFIICKLSVDTTIF